MFLWDWLHVKYGCDGPGRSLSKPGLFGSWILLEQSLAQLKKKLYQMIDEFKHHESYAVGKWLGLVVLLGFLSLDSCDDLWHLECRYPDEEVGQVPIAFVVRRPNSNLDEAQIMDFVAGQVFAFLLWFLMAIYNLNLLW